jgi:three-Cys-motif partner protein
MGGGAEVGTWDEDAEDEDFYSSQSPASRVKIAIVTKYFGAWAKILGWSPRLAYLDLYCGPGRYKDNRDPSTPVLIVQQIIADPKLRGKVETHFNDENPEHSAELAKNLRELPGYETLKHKPSITTQTVDRGFEEQLTQIGQVPTLSFVDPFGYKGVTLKLLERMLRGFGCDLVLFFSYNRINAAITNDNVEEHIIALFGEERFEELKKKLAGRSAAQRERIILDTLGQALKARGFEYVLPFTFTQSERRRVSHHLIFVSKNYLGYKVMKDIMGKASSSHEEGVPSFGYAPPISQDETPLLFEFARPLEQLGAMLLEEYAGQTTTFDDLFSEHNVGRPFVERNYRDAVLELEEEGKVKVTTDKKRIKREGKLTLPRHARLTFPPKESK